MVRRPGVAPGCYLRIRQAPSLAGSRRSVVDAVVVVGVDGLEPSTTLRIRQPLSPLSYTPWSARLVLPQLPPACRAGALAVELQAVAWDRVGSHHRLLGFNQALGLSQLRTRGAGVECRPRRGRVQADRARWGTGWFDGTDDGSCTRIACLEGRGPALERRPHGVATGNRTLIVDLASRRPSR